MKSAPFCLAILAGCFAAGCNNNKPSSTTPVTDIRQSSTPPSTVQPIQPVQPVQPVVSDTPAVVTPAVATTVTPATGGSYTIQRGDTLFKIARAKYGDASAVRKIKEANPGLDADHIKVGQKINLP